MPIHSVHHGHFSMPAFIQKHGHMLKEHLREKCINRFWLGEALNTHANPHRYFPYRPEMDGQATIENKQFTPILAPFSLPQDAPGKPAFLVNIPVAHLPLASGYEKLESMIKRLKEETFGQTTAAASRAHAQSKLAVVFGVNQIQSIDSEVNQAFEKYIEEIPRIDGLPYRVTGFFWTPSWEENSSWKKVKGVEKTLANKPSLEEKIYSRDRAFRILKYINPPRAKSIRQLLEGQGSLSLALQSQIPFQQIRQTIKESPFTLAFAQKFSTSPKPRPVFFVTMDADFLKLRTSAKGYFSIYEDIIAETKHKKGYYPNVISLGYQLSPDALPIARIAVKCDQNVRIAMHTHIPGSIYFPEPGTGYYLSRNGKLIENLQKFSFLAPSGQDKRAFESRRAINNGIRLRILHQSRFIYEPKYALITTMPGRMATTTAKKYQTLNPADFKKWEVLRALRGISQVHFSPLDWAHYLYEGLPANLKTGAGIYGKTSRVLSRIFAAFDPINLIQTYKKTEAASYPRAFNKIFGFYQKYSEALYKGERKGNYTIIRRIPGPQIKLNHELEKTRIFIQAQFSLLMSAKDELAELGFSDPLQEKVIDAARASGHAILSTLQEEMQAI